jgi:hypothetical protein
MENRAFNLERQDLSFVEPPSRTDELRSSELIPCPALVSVPFATAKELQSKNRRRRKRLLSFIKLELCALALLTLLLVAGASKQFAQPRLTLPFEVAIVVIAAAVAIIPVIFYGPTRQKYRYRSHRLVQPE